MSDDRPFSKVGEMVFAHLKAGMAASQVCAVALSEKMSLLAPGQSSPRQPNWNDLVSACA